MLENGLFYAFEQTCRIVFAHNSVNSIRERASEQCASSHQDDVHATVHHLERLCNRPSSRLNEEFLVEDDGIDAVIADANSHSMVWSVGGHHPVAGVF